MNRLDDIAQRGTLSPGFSREDMPTGHILCRDGYALSVQAGVAMHCTPRPGWPGTGPLGRVAMDYPGPYLAFEVGFPTARPEPWADWEPHCDEPDNPTGTIYNYVPFDRIRALIELHGGEWVTE